MKNKTIAIVGIGRMGEQIARKLPQIKKLILVDKEPTARIKNIAKELRAFFTNDYSGLERVDIAILALNPDQIALVMDCLAKVVKRKCIFVNISTYTSLDKARNLINVKIIGEAGEIARGNEPGIIIPYDLEEKHKKLMRSLFKYMGEVFFLNVDDYKDVNYIAAREIVRSVKKVARLFTGKKIISDISRIAINNVMSGTCRTYPWSADDDFMQRVLSDGRGK